MALVLVGASCSTASDVSSVEANETPDEIPDDTADETGTEADGTVQEGSLDWGACDDEPAVDIDLQCSTLEVPLDHEDPDGETIDIARRPGAGDRPDERIGSLVFNPAAPAVRGSSSCRRPLSPCRPRSPSGSTSSASTRAASAPAPRSSARS